METQALFDIVGKCFPPDLEAMTKFINHCFADEDLIGKKILDAGCGTGASIEPFCKKGVHQIVGVDLSIESLKRTKSFIHKNNLSNVCLTKADITNLPFINEHFDIVFSIGSLPYIDNVAKALSELSRVLKRSGVLLVMLLKKGRYDSIFFVIRVALSQIPDKFSIKLSKIFSLILAPFGVYLLKRH